MGNIYPIFIALLVAVGSIFEVELYLGLIHVALAAAALFICDSIKPVLISLLTFVMQISVAHSPYYPSYSDYFFTGWRVFAVMAMALAVFIAFSAFIIKRRIYKKISFRSTPFLIPLIPLFLAFLLNGAFSGKWVLGDLWLGLLNAFVFCILPVLLYHGFSEKEDSESLSKYFSYISMLTALVVMAELCALFMRGGKIFEGGSINKTEVALGWGIWTLIGITLSLLIPIIFYGAHKNKYPWIYFGVATAAYIFAVLTMSRGALLFGGAGYFVCLILSCFKGKRRRTFRKILFSEIVFAVCLFLLLRKEILTLLSDYLERGFSDNGRFELWRAAFKNFLRTPIFGGGFYGFSVDDSVLYPFGPLAKQAHNTPLQLLSAMGSFGFASYAFYRLSTMRAIFHRPTTEKTFMGISIAVLLVGSLLDNFIFNIYPMHFYTVALVIIYKAEKETQNLQIHAKTCQKYINKEKKKKT